MVGSAPLGASVCKIFVSVGITPPNVMACTTVHTSVSFGPVVGHATTASAYDFSYRCVLFGATISYVTFMNVVRTLPDMYMELPGDYY